MELLSIKSSKRYMSVCGFYFFLFQCVDTFTCEQISIKKQLELLGT